VALANIMRLSLLKAAHVGVGERSAVEGPAVSPLPVTQTRTLNP
jgi:hypothetical protein